ncbi:hypothetical protein TN91_23615 [Rhodococcus ruber]|nr:hypothetical protein TN91_23615 [Rhodococcus ruber]
MQGADAALFIGHRRLQSVPDLRGEIFREPESAVVIDDGVLDQLDGQVRHVAVAILPPPAYEVGVAGAVVASHRVVDQARGAASPSTAVTEQHALEVVLVNPVAVAPGAAGFKHVLDPVEQLLADDRLVPPWIDLALVGDEADVVWIAQHAVQLADGDRLLRPAGRRADCQAKVGHLVVEPFQGVITGGVELEGLQDEWRSAFIKRNGVDQVTLKLLPDIEVAQLGAGDGAAVKRLVAHLDPDVLAAELVLDLVHDVGDGFHGFGVGAFAEVLAGREQPDAELVEVALGDGGVHEVAEGP